MSRSQRRKKKISLRQKTEIQRYIDSIDEYQQPPRRPIRLEDSMANLHLDSESEEETSIPIETCRVISHRGGRNGRGRGEPLNPQRTNFKVCPKETCRTTSPFTDSDEELCFPDDKKKSKMTLKNKCPKLGSSSDSEEAEDVDNTEDSSEEVTQIQLRSGKQVLPLPQKKAKEQEKNIQLNQAAMPQDPPKPKTTNANVD